MHSYTDMAGRTWAVSINVTAVKNVRGLVGVDLNKLIDDQCRPLGELVADPVRLCDVLYGLCRDEAAVRGITEAEFSQALGGDALFSATVAFIDELIDFFPDARARKALTRVVDAGRRIRDQLLVEVELMLEQIDPVSDARKLMRWHGASPASSDSTLAP